MNPRALENALLEFRLCDGYLARPLVPRPYRHAHSDYCDEGKVEFFEGNFTEYEEAQETHAGRRRAGAEAYQVQAYCEVM